MVINDTHNFIFVHVSKSAGSSDTKLLSSFGQYSDLEVGGTELGEAIQPFMQRRFGLSKHVPLMIYAR